MGTLIRQSFIVLVVIMATFTITARTYRAKEVKIRNEIADLTLEIEAQEYKIEMLNRRVRVCLYEE